MPAACVSGTTFSVHCVFFFFQAEDGIRDFHVTGVQTCALPICQGSLTALFSVLHTAPRRWSRSDIALVSSVMERTWHAVENARVHAALRQSREWLRSEERRVGKEGRAGWALYE